MFPAAPRCIDVSEARPPTVVPAKAGTIRVSLSNFESSALPHRRANGIGSRLHQDDESLVSWRTDHVRHLGNNASAFSRSIFAKSAALSPQDQQRAESGGASGRGAGDGRLWPNTGAEECCGRPRSSRCRTPTSINSGQTLYKLFFKNYSEKVWGLPCDQMSGDWVTQRSKGMSLVTAVKDAVIPSKGEVVSLIDEFMYPKYGFGRLSERMTDKITVHGQ